MANDPQTIRANYLNLPKQVREWLASETPAYLIGEINDRLGLDEEKSAVIPNLVLRLVTQDLETANFINEISDALEVNWQTAKAIAEDVEKKVLKPIENDLRRETGIDLKLIYFGKPRPQTAAPAEKISPIGPISPTGAGPAPLPPVSHPTEWEKLRGVPLEAAAPKKEISPIGPISPTGVEATPLPAPAIPLEAARPMSPLGAEARAVPLTGPAPTPPKEEKKVKLETFAEPFFLHKEEISEPGKEPVKETPKAQPRLNIKVQNYFETETPKPAPKPAAAKVEIPAAISEIKTAAQNLTANISEQKTRIVHYNEMRTPLTNAGTPKTAPIQNQVDLRRFTKPEINAIDLRKNLK